MIRRNGALLDNTPSFGRRLDRNDPDESYVGQKIRGLRKQKKVSLTDLAEATGHSVGFLSQVERNKSNPSVKALYDISRALDVNITWFFEESEPTNSQNKGPIISVKDRKRIYYGVDICDELLSPVTNKQLELIWSRFAPGASSGTEPYQHEGEEAGAVLSGTLELVIGDETYRLDAGDSFGFNSKTPHRYSNPGTIDTIVVWAVSPPTY